MLFHDSVDTALPSADTIIEINAVTQITGVRTRETLRVAKHLKHPYIMF